MSMDLDGRVDDPPRQEVHLARRLPKSALASARFA
jgi:hypothetical protein